MAKTHSCTSECRPRFCSGVCRKIWNIMQTALRREFFSSQNNKNDWYTMLFAIICLHLCSFLLPRAKEENIFIIFIIIIIIRVLRWLRRGAIAIWWLFEAWKRKLGQRKNVEREAFPRDTQRVFGFTGFILAAVWSRRFQVVGIQARKRVAQIVSGRRRLSI